ncbi:carbohydrate-binding protein [Streptomyces sp. S.PB5]|uniref:carbohydrate-binding protein n=1 Tax=Streptomyces sp. S.PB5 TaxID=3020844 RepID=UPI0025B27C85|nr:carbohydrate-binding protein [Streptomyces sp. S.PB5]MDN3023428.1 carbohydrate-binding protein [Streptomyces sp. S.PB5]
MTSGTTGANTPPEDDDPFGYLYADGQANGAQPPSGGYGYPNSVNRVRPVGQRQYGQQQPAAPTAPYGQVPQQQGAYGQPNAHYAAPETHPGGAPTVQHSQPAYGGHGGGGRGRGPNTKGLLIGAIAVVAAVVIGIGVAMMGGDGDGEEGGNQAGTTPSAQESGEPSASASSSAEGENYEETIDAKAMRLGTGVTTASDVQGASADGGIYVTGLNQPGAEVTWTVNGIPKEGTYTLFSNYSVPGKDQSMTLKVNGKVFGTKLSMKNYAKAPEGDYAKGWTTTYAWPTLTKGTNTISISCQPGDQCDVLLSQVWLKEGQVTK